MKLLLELKREPQRGTVSGSDRPYVRLIGVDSNNRHSRAIAFGFTAENIIKKIYSMVSPTDDIADKGITVELTGEWKNAQPYVDANGKTQTPRAFHIDTFQFLLGASLEIKKIKQDAKAALHRAESFRVAGDYRQAYRELLLQIGATCNMEDHVHQIAATLEAHDNIDDELVEPLAEDVSSTPEAAALKKFAAINRVDEPMTLAPSSSASAEVVEPTPSSSSDLSTEDDDIVFGEDSTESDVIEEGMMVSSDENSAAEEPANDVFDDEPAAEEQNDQEAAPEAEAKPVNGFGRPAAASGFGRPAGSGFGRPALGGFGRPR